MRVPLSWLTQHVDITVSATALADRLTFAGVEIETVERVGEDLAGIVTARVLEVRGHPNADRLVLVRIDIGDGDDRSVVCGARNFAPGDVVPWAAPGAKLPGGVEVGRRQVRGEWSDGMLASARELGVFDDHSGILVLPPDTTVGADLVETVGLRDAILDVKSAPNRGDTLSMRGIAREVAVLLGTELKPLDLTVPETGPAASGLAEVQVEDAEGCPLYVARVVQGLDAARPAPLWMARRLYLYGQRPLGAVVDVTNYLLLDQGQPLHAFDLERVPGQRIVVRRAAEGETLRTLDGRDRRLTAADTLITSGEQALALAGIMGGEDSEVRLDTTRILIESAHFPPATVRRTMRRLGMSTEGGQRWARGVDPAGAEPVCDQAAALMAQLAGGTVAAGRLRAGPGVGERPAIRLDWARSAARLGAPTDPRFAAHHLRSVGCRAEVADDRTVVAVPPSWRFDIELWADLEEEVARRWGYDQIPATLPKATGGRLTDQQRLRRQTRGLLAGMGLTEAQTYPFLSQAAFDQLGFDPDDPRRRTLRLANPISEEAPELRTTLLPGLAEVARRNLARGLAGVAVYELGAVFLPSRPGPDRELPDEPLTLGLLLAGQRQRGRFDDPTAAFDFADVKGVVDGLVAGLGVEGVGYRAEGPPPYHPGRCAGVLLGQRAVGLLGQLHPRVAAELELPAATFAAELELVPLLAAVPRMRPAATPSPYPELSFDVAFLVPPGVAASDLEAALREAGGEQLTRLDLFDAYQGPPLPPGHRNLAYRVALQAPDRTLTDADGAAARDRMATLAADRLQATLRASD
ncbi:MAG TPA: phenylalanine--tRNA ligase subunit beta [Actinomycetota bacterium]|nr:phenylalanine--tRNA ligase subunit beta [Actinomycetota bacterium]